jgi:shikimate dehydrogenase
MENYAVIGKPIQQSKSPFIHRCFAEQWALPIKYVPLLGEEGGFVRQISQFIEQGGRGMNVTSPFKLDACQFSDVLSARATAAQAVNTLTFHQDGSVSGDNTDGVGLVTDLKTLVEDLVGKRIIIIGAGGATRGVISSLFDAGIAHIHIANRTIAKAQQLVDHFSDMGSLSCSQLDEVTETSASLVINATSTGVNDQQLQIDNGVFEQVQYCYDMFYSQQITPFNRLALAKSPECKIRDGLGMLVGQAAESFYIWTGKRPDIAPVLSELRTRI